MDVVIPLPTLRALMAPHYTVAGRGRRPLPLETMLRVYFLQQWFDLSDPQAEDMLYDSESMRRLRAWSWARLRCRTNPRFCAFGICWKRRS